VLNSIAPLEDMVMSRFGFRAMSHKTRLLSSVATIVLLAASGTAQAGNSSVLPGVLGGVIGAAIINQALQPRAAPVPAPVYVPVPVPVAPPPQYYYQAPARRSPAATSPTTTTVTKLTNADKDELEDLRRQLHFAGVVQNDLDISVVIVSHDTQRVTRNLAGDPQFAGQVEGCYPFGPISMDSSLPEGRFFLDVKEKIEKKGNGRVDIAKCTAKNFAQYDLLVFSASQLDPEVNPNIKMGDIRPIAAGVIQAIKDGTYLKFIDPPYSRATYEAEVQTRKDAIVQDEVKRAADKEAAQNAFDNRVGADLSALYMKLPPGTTCVAADVQPEQLYQPDSPFAELGTRPNHFRILGDANAIFLALKRHECSAVIGTTAMLRDDLIPAFKRDNLVFNYDPHFIAAATSPPVAVAHEPGVSVTR
jgi:hypothetical protein